MSNKCSVCPNDAVAQVRVIYSESPFGQDSDDVALCQRHLTEAENRYQVINL